MLFLFGAVLLVIGMGIFTLGVDMSMIPMGEARELALVHFWYWPHCESGLRSICVPCCWRFMM